MKLDTAKNAIETAMELILDNQGRLERKFDESTSKLEIKIDKINEKLFIGNGTPSWDKRLDRLEQTAAIKNNNAEHKWSFWVSTISLVISGLVVPLILYYTHSPVKP